MSRRGRKVETVNNKVLAKICFQACFLKQGKKERPKWKAIRDYHVKMKKLGNEASIDINEESEKVIHELSKKYIGKNKALTSKRLSECKHSEVRRLREKEVIKITEKYDKVRVLMIWLDTYPDPNFFEKRVKGKELVDWTADKMLKVLKKTKRWNVFFRGYPILIEFTSVSDMDCIEAIRKYKEKCYSIPEVNNQLVYVVDSILVENKLKRKAHNYKKFKQSGFYLGSYIWTMKNLSNPRRELKRSLILPVYIGSNRLYKEKSDKIKRRRYVFPMTGVFYLRKKNAIGKSGLYRCYIEKWMSFFSNKRYFDLSTKSLKIYMEGEDKGTYTGKDMEELRKNPIAKYVNLNVYENEQRIVLEKGLYLHVDNRIIIRMPDTIVGAKLAHTWLKFGKQFDGMFYTN